MEHDLVTSGLMVVQCKPAPYAYDVPLTSTITLTLNADINPQSTVGNFIVIEDTELAFKEVSQLKDRDLFKPVKGALTYKDRVLTFTPSGHLTPHTRYIVIMKQGGIRAIDGSTLGHTYIASFCTTTDDTYTPATFLAPSYGDRHTKAPLFKWQQQASPSYLFSISTEIDFSVIVYETVIYKSGSDVYAACEHQPDILLRDGMYYARVRALNGAYSDPLQFNILEHQKTLVTEADFDDSVYDDVFIDDRPLDLQLVKSFPKAGAMNIKLNTGLFYLVFAGLVQEEDIDWQSTYVEGTLFDEEDEETLEHGDVDGEWSLVYDEVRDVTYAIFNLPSTEIEEEAPSDSEDVEDDEVMEDVDEDN